MVEGGPTWVIVLSGVFGLAGIIVSAWLGPTAVEKIRARRQSSPDPQSTQETARQHTVEALDLVKDAMNDYQARLTSAEQQAEQFADHEIRLTRLEAHVFKDRPDRRRRDLS